MLVVFKVSFFFRNCGIPFVTTPSTSSPKLWFKKLIKVINVYLKQVKSFLFMEYTGFYSGLLPPDTLSRPFTPPPQNCALSTLGALQYSLENHR